MSCELYRDDCLKIMKVIPDDSIDLILTDPPYGTIRGLNKNADKYNRGYRACDWDTAFDTKILFPELSRILRPNGRCLLFGQEPFSSSLIADAIPSLPFNYRAIWKKNSPGNTLGSKKAMVNYYEDILIFSKIFPKHDYNGDNSLREYFSKVFDFISKPKSEIIATIGQRADHCFRLNSPQFTLCTEETYRDLILQYDIQKMPGFMEWQDLKNIEISFRKKLCEMENKRFPSVFNLWRGENSKSNILEYAKDTDGFHPTQKPILLLEDLIKTFSNEGDTVLDFTMGSGSTGVACVNTGRNFIGIELDEGYFSIAKDRINNFFN